MLFVRLLTLALLIPAATVLLGCGGAPSQAPGPPSSGLRVLATSGPVGDAVRAVVGDRGSVEVLMGPGIDPHLYRERPSDLKKLNSADVVFYNGLHFEGIHDVLEKLGERRPVFALSAGLEAGSDPRLQFPDGVQALPDPHLWHDASIWRDCVGEVALRLAEVDAPRAAEYAAAAAGYAAELDTLHEWCKTQIATIPEERRVLVTAHDAFGYFSAAYGIETIGLKGVSTEDEVDLGHLQEVVQTVVERKIPAVFVETAVADRIVKALVEPCRAEGHEVVIGGELYADALGDAESGADTYSRMMRANVRTIVTALGGTIQDPEAAPATP